MTTILLLAIVSGVAIIIPSWSVIHDPYGRGLSKIKANGYILIIAVVFLVILPVIQYKYQKKEQKKENDLRDSVLQRRYDSSLLEVKKNFDSSSFKTDSIIADNLGKYGYKFDSAKNELLTKIATTSEGVAVPPIFGLSMNQKMPGFSFIETDADGNNCKLNFVNRDAGSSCFDVKMPIVIGYSGELVPLRGIGSDPLIFYSNKFPKDYYLTMYSEMHINPGATDIYFWLHGTYKNIGCTITYQVDEVYKYLINKKALGLLNGEERDQVVSILKNQK